MKIKQANSYRPAFGSIKIAEAKNYIKNIETPIAIYKLTKNDESFLNYLKDYLNFSNMMSKLPENMCEIWREIFNITITEAKNSQNTSLLAVFQNKAVAILNYTENNYKYKVKSVCSWPTEQDKKVPYAGKTLFAVLFKHFLQNNGKYIDIDAITNGPFNAVGKYMSLGFKQRGGENYILAMRAENENIAKTVKSLDEFIKITPVTDNKEVSLFEIIK